MPTRPADKFIEVEGHRVRCWETGSGPPVLLVHGLGSSVLTWLGTMNGMEGFRLLALDLPGHGLSEMPKRRFRLPDAARFVAAFMDAVGAPSAHLVGNSMGGLVSLELALSQPHRVDSLALVDSVGLGREIARFLRLASVPGVGEYFERPNRDRIRRISRALVYNPTCIRDEMVEEMYGYRLRKGAPRANMKFLREGVSPFAQRQATIRAREIVSLEPPLLVVWGREDPVVPVQQAVAAVSRVRQSELHVIDECGHWPQIEHPERFKGILGSFLRSGLVAATARERAPEQALEHLMGGDPSGGQPDEGSDTPGALASAGASHGAEFGAAAAASPPLWVQTKHLRLLALALVVAVIITAVLQRGALTDFESFTDRFGYAAIFILSLAGAGAMVLPLPSTAAVFFAGALLVPVFVGLVSGVGETLGEITGYGLGYSGQGIVERSRLYRRIERWISRRGWVAILVLSVVPNPVFDFLGIAAGVLRYPLRRFLFYTWIGKTVKNIGLAYAGFLGASWVADLFGVTRA